MAKIETNLVDLRVDESMVTAILEKKIEEAIGVAIIDKEQVVAQLIDRCLSMRVDEKGQPSSYSSAKPFIEYSARKAIADAVKTALDTVMESRRKQLEVAVVKQIERSTNKLARALVDGLAESLKSRWSSTISIRLDGDKG